MTITAIEQNTWVEVCHEDDLIDQSGVCVLLPTPQASAEYCQVALFYFAQLKVVYAIDNYDPFGQANVLYRGIVGSIGDELMVASPLYKQHFSLTTGLCFEDKTHIIPVYETKIVDGVVYLRRPSVE